MMQSRITLPVLAVLAMAALPQKVEAQSPTVAFVAVQAVLQKTPGYDKAEATWNTESEGYQRQMTQLQSRMDSATSAFEQQSVMLSASKRATEQKKLQDLATELNQQVDDLRQQAGKRQRELLNPIEERVMAVIEGLRAEGNFTVVFDVSNQYNTIVAADTSADLTQKAIQRLTGSTGTPQGN